MCISRNVTIFILSMLVHNSIVAQSVCVASQFTRSFSCSLLLFFWFVCCLVTLILISLSLSLYFIMHISFSSIIMNLLASVWSVCTRSAYRKLLFDHHTHWHCFSSSFIDFVGNSFFFLFFSHRIHAIGQSGSELSPHFNAITLKLAFLLVLIAFGIMNIFK